MEGFVARPKKVAAKSAGKVNAKLEAALAEMDPEQAKVVREALADETAEKEVAKQMKTDRERQDRETHYWITLIRMQDDNEPYAFVGAAGVAYKLDKGVRLPVPKSVINALRSAKVSGYVPVVDDATGQAKSRRVEYERYPFQLDGVASPEDIRHWKLEQQAKARRRDGLVDVPEEEEVMGRPQHDYGPMQTMGAGLEE